MNNILKSMPLKSLVNNKLNYKSFIISYKYYSVINFNNNYSNFNSFHESLFLSKLKHQNRFNTRKLNTKPFVENENDFAFGIIQSIGSAVGVKHEEVINESIDDNSSFHTIVYKNFMKTSTEDYSRNTALINDLIKHLNKLSLIELKEILIKINDWTDISFNLETTHNKLWTSLDEELTKRLMRMSFDDKQVLSEALSIGNLWYIKNTAKFCKFNQILVKKLNSIDMKLTKEEFLHLMFYSNLHRYIDENSKFNICKHFQQLINELDIDQIGVVCMAFFKTRTKLTESLYYSVIEKAFNELKNTTNKYTKVAIFKSLRYSNTFTYKAKVEHLIKNIKHFEDYNELELTHLVSLLNQAKIYDKSILDKAFNKLCDNPNGFRAKDIDRLLLSFCNFNYKLDSVKTEFLCEHIIDRRDVGFFPSYLLSIIYYMTIMNYFSDKLINRCLNTTFLDRIHNTAKHDYERNLITVNTSLMIEKYGDYSQLLLSPERVKHFHQLILKKEKSDISQKSRKTWFLNKIYMSLKPENGAKGIKTEMSHIFPFSSYPFVIFTDDLQKRLYIDFSDLRENQFKGLNVVFILFFNDYIDSSNKLIKGNPNLEIRLLKRLGFNVIIIPFHELNGLNSLPSIRHKILSEWQS